MIKKNIALTGLPVRALSIFLVVIISGIIEKAAGS